MGIFYSKPLASPSTSAVTAPVTSPSTAPVTEQQVRVIVKEAVNEIIKVINDTCNDNNKEYDEEDINDNTSDTNEYDEDEAPPGAPMTYTEGYIKGKTFMETIDPDYEYSIEELTFMYNLYHKTDYTTIGVGKRIKNMFTNIRKTINRRQVHVYQLIRPRTNHKRIH